MRALALAALALAACPAGLPRVDKPIVDPHGSDAGDQTTGCLSDDACGDGLVCVNCEGVGQCTPGCRDSSECGARDICQLGTVCQACPCPPGWCVLNPCRDDDSDGYVPGNDATVECPGKKKGDCDDRAPDVHPHADEICTNYVDDNCDGKYDERDPQCTCPNNEQRCGNTWECGAAGSTSCNKGCCQACPALGNEPSCSWNTGLCAQQHGINPYSSCSYGWVCDWCNGCPTTVDPVCGANGSTYDNTCLLEMRTKLLHHGACLGGEGMYCDVQGGGVGGLDGGCGPSGEFYCRKSCPQGTSCGVSQCTKKGACLVDSDCPAGLPAPSCDAGTPAQACVDGACVTSCH